jgi:hypothetical protein
MSSIVALREFEIFFITAFQSFHPHRRAGAGNDAQGKGAIQCFGPYEVPLHSRIVAAKQKLTAYASPAARGSIRRALDLVGLDSERLRLMAVDSRPRMDVTALKQAMGADRERGFTPFLDGDGEAGWRSTPGLPAGRRRAYPYCGAGSSVGSCRRPLDAKAGSGERSRCRLVRRGFSCSRWSSRSSCIGNSCHCGP